MKSSSSSGEMSKMAMKNLFTQAHQSQSIFFNIFSKYGMGCQIKINDLIAICAQKKKYLTGTLTNIRQGLM